MYAARFNANPEITRALITAGADVKAKDSAIPLQSPFKRLPCQKPGGRFLPQSGIIHINVKTH